MSPCFFSRSLIKRNGCTGANNHGNDDHYADGNDCYADGNNDDYYVDGNDYYVDGNDDDDYDGIDDDDYWPIITQSLQLQQRSG